MDLEFGEEVARVRVGGVDADVEAGGDFFGGEAFDHEAEEVEFAGIVTVSGTVARVGSLDAKATVSGCARS